MLFVIGIGLGSQFFAPLEESDGSSSAESVKGFELVDSATSRGMGMVA